MSAGKYGKVEGDDAFAGIGVIDERLARCGTDRLVRAPHQHIHTVEDRRDPIRVLREVDPADARRERRDVRSRVVADVRRHGGARRGRGEREARRGHRRPVHGRGERRRDRSARGDPDRAGGGRGGRYARRRTGFRARDGDSRHDRDGRQRDEQSAPPHACASAVPALPARLSNRMARPRSPLVLPVIRPFAPPVAASVERATDSASLGRALAHL